MTADTALTVSLAELADSWFISLDAARRSPATIKAYQAGVRGFLGWHTRMYPHAVPVLDKASVNAYLADLRHLGQSAGTARLRFSALRLFTAWLTEEGEIDRDPLVSMKPPAPGKPEVNSLPDTDIDALLKACKGTEFADRRDTAIVMVLATTGLRAGEVTALTVTDVDLRGRVINIRRAKGGKNRKVPLLPATAQAIDRYLRVRRGHKLVHTDMLWLGGQGREFGYQGLARALGERATTAGISGFHAHRLRHTFASRWLGAGGSEDGLMAVAGWSDRNMIQRYTADTAQKRAAEEAMKLKLDQF